MPLSTEDLAALAEIGISDREAARQLALLDRPPGPLRLLRPCTVGDGILRLTAEEASSCARRAQQELDSGTIIQFLPASGAASRMFGTLIAALQEEPSPPWRTLEARAWKGDEVSRGVLRLMADLERLPFADPLARELGESEGELKTLLRRGRWRTILRALLDPAGLGYAELPKGLIPFHVQDGRARTALAEQLATGAELAAGSPRGHGFHVTVAPGWQEDFQAEAARAARGDGTAYRVTVSAQEPATGTLALTADGRLVRDAAGHPLTRPGGHGALLANLERCESAIVLLRNIDNVLPRGSWRSAAVSCRRVLLGLLLTVRDELAAALDRLTMRPVDPQAVAEVRALLEHRFGAGALPPPGDELTVEQELLVDRLDRPLRVCGMVPSSGDPGGGPFWVAADDGKESLQIVEAAQIATTDAEQDAIWHRSTHFNPVDLACAIADSRGRRYDLSRFIDPDAVIVSEKRVGTVTARVLERPGLWNGAMARWNTLFVEIPRHTFAPVKTVFDLLRPEHRGVDDPSRSESP
ncbi:MAG: DUF4301 family protein [Thermoanaerobaculia bacterium]